MGFIRKNAGKLSRDAVRQAAARAAQDGRRAGRVVDLHEEVTPALLDEHRSRSPWCDLDAHFRVDLGPHQAMAVEHAVIVFADKLTNYGPIGSFAGGTGTVVPVYSDQRFLNLIDPATNENILTISCERRLTAGSTGGVLVSRLRERIDRDQSKEKGR